MTLISASTFSLQVPEHFESTVVVGEAIRAQTFRADHDMQAPELVCCLIWSSADTSPYETKTALFIPTRSKLN